MESIEMSESFDEMERIFLALSDKTRIKLVGLIGDGEVSVNYLCESLGVSQPKVSRHLAYLRAMGMVHTRRDGKWIYYSLFEPESREGSRLFRDTLSWITSQLEPASNGFSSNREPRSPDRGKAEDVTPIDTYAYADANEANDELEVYLL